MSEITNLSKKNQRQMSDFVSRELLYDWLIGLLDSDRKAALESQVANSKELQSELAKIQTGLDYANILSQTQISSTLMERLYGPITWGEILISKLNFTKWSLGVRWSVEAAIVGIVFTLFASSIQWNKFYLPRNTNSSIVVAEVAKEVSQKTLEANSNITSSPTANAASVSVTSTASATPSSTYSGVEKTIATPSATPYLVTLAPTPLSASLTPPPTPAQKAIAEDRGYLFRGTWLSENFEQDSETIRSFVIELGGKKAGDVELGTHRQDGAYFHFTLPEENYQKFLDKVSAIRPIKLVREKHPRKMPVGVVRCILLVRQAKE